MPSLDPMGVGIHPREMVRGLRHEYIDNEMLFVKEGPVKVGELTKPMVNVIPQVTANCLDPGGNIDKESRPV